MNDDVAYFFQFFSINLSFIVSLFCFLTLSRYYLFMIMLQRVVGETLNTQICVPIDVIINIDVVYTNDLCLSFVLQTAPRLALPNLKKISQFFTYPYMQLIHIIYIYIYLCIYIYHLYITGEY